MSFAGQWEALGSELPAGWSRADLRFELRDPARAAEAAALLAPAQPYRSSPTMFQLASAHDGSAPSPDNLTRLLRRHADAGADRQGDHPGRSRDPVARRIVATGDRGAAVRLERSAWRNRAALDG